VDAIVAIAAFPVTIAVLWSLLRSPLGGRLVAVPSDERWHGEATPMFGGVGIFAGYAAGVLLALAVGAVEWSGELGGILAGVAILFATGLVDDLRHLSPLVKLAAQVVAAVVALASGLTVEIVGNDVLAWAIGLLWLVGITNAFNLLDNMDGLAATLAGIACAYFAIDAVTEHPNDTVLVLAISLGLACAGFLPFNLRPRRRAAVFMGDSGSLVLGFGLASLALASSWTVAGATAATIALPLLVLAIPILDTTLVTVARLAGRRPVTRGGKDHSSHRLVYYGLSDAKAVLLLALVAAAIGASALAYNVLDNGRLTAIGVLVTFVLLVQFGSFLSDLEERSRRGAEIAEPPLWRALVFEPRRLVEVVVDFVVICASFLAAYLLVLEGMGTEFERSVFLSALPILLAIRYVLFVALGIYRRVWRFATARDVVPIGLACVVSAAIAYLVLRALRPIGSFPALEILVVDAVLCTLLVGGSRLTLRLLPELRARSERRRVLVIGAGRAGRGLARELREHDEAHVVGFLDDNPRVRRRRILGITVLGGLDEAERAIGIARADEVLVTIPDAPRERLDAVVRAAEGAGIPCRIVRRHTEFTSPEPVEAILP
jgi:UDP-GlcNAc:undecaprenyl-phosphate GlcNAc-1-phosphate transferase